VRQTAVDTVAGVLAIVDGVAFLQARPDAFRLLIGDRELSGNLTDLFLEANEEGAE
jgi:hypothetical protein